MVIQDSVAPKTALARAEASAVAALAQSEAAATIEVPQGHFSEDMLQGAAMGQPGAAALDSTVVQIPEAENGEHATRKAKRSSDDVAGEVGASPKRHKVGPTTCVKGTDVMHLAEIQWVLL